ncbi:putative ribonuclease H-like domain-containing protein [Tanacetum coccineum]
MFCYRWCWTLIGVTWRGRNSEQNGSMAFSYSEVTNDKGFVDSGCSRHMTGNIAHLSYFKDFNGGYVTFCGGAYGGKITGTVKLDETSEILKNFIKEVENLVDKKVKIIRSDNGTEFKNKVMDDFCREKRTGGGARGIKRGISVAWTPQQNGVANGELVGTSLRLLEQLVAGKIFYDFQVSKEFLFMKDKDELHDEDDATKVSSHDGSSLKENGTADQQEEPKRVSQALRDLAWVEAMQEELIQFKLQKVWILVDLPKGHRCNFYKVVSETMKDERGGALSSEKQARTCCSKDITKYTDRLLMTQSLYCGLDLRQSDVPSL